LECVCELQRSMSGASHTHSSGVSHTHSTHAAYTLEWSVTYTLDSCCIHTRVECHIHTLSTQQNAQWSVYVSSSAVLYVSRTHSQH
jgi:hypothetical protein